MKKDRGITLTALIITIIVMVILVGVILVFIDTEFGIVEKANNAKIESEIAESKERIGLEYAILKNNQENKDKSNLEKFQLLKDKLNLKIGFIGSDCMIIEIKDGEFVTLLTDGTIIEGKKLYLNIEEGDIDLKEKGFIQNNGELIEYNGDYIISGTTTEYCVRIMEEGIYNITIKNLNIDMTGKDKCAFNANRGYKPMGCYVNINIEENNKLIGDGAPGLGFAKATANIDGTTNGSTLSINGDGTLEVIGGKFSAAIGSGYSGLETAAGDVSNIIINSGNIIAKPGANGCAIGGGLRKNVNNIIINGGNINAIASNRAGIGASEEGILQNLVINGGNITVTGGEYGGAIGGSEGSKNIIINGGYIQASTNFAYSYGQYYALGHKCDDIIINGGTLICYSKKDSGIYSDATPVKITGGNIYSTGGTAAIGNSEMAKVPTNGNESLYLTKIQLPKIEKQTKITKIITTDNLNYGITDMYTLEDGMLYLYLPLGERTVTAEAGGRTYSGTVTTTSDIFEVTTLVPN